MSVDRHKCRLVRKEVSGFPKLAPNASSFTKLKRRIREFLGLNSNSYRCKKFFPSKTASLAEQKRHATSPYFYIAHPFSNFNRVVEILYAVIWFYCIVNIPMMTFRLSDEAGIVYMSVRAIQWLIILSLFFIGYVDKNSKEIVIEPKRIALNYVKTYFFVDVIAGDIIFAFIDHTIFVSIYTDDFYIYYSVARRLLQMMCYYARINTVVAVLQRTGNEFHVNKSFQKVIIQILTTFIFIHICACTLYFIPKILYPKGLPKDSWLIEANIDPTTKPPIGDIYVECFLMTVCYFFGAGTGVYKVYAPVEKVILSFISLFGRLYTLHLLADVLNLFGITDISQSAYRQQLALLEEFIRSKGLPFDMKNKLHKYYEYKLQRRYFNEKEILSTLTDQIRTELFLFGARKFTRKAQALKTLSISTIGVILSMMKSEVYAPHDVILNINNQEQNLYFISSGTVAVININGDELDHLQDGEEFGIHNLFFPSKQRYVFTAVEPTEVYFIDRKTYMNCIEGHKELIMEFNEKMRRRRTTYEEEEEDIRRGGSDVLSELRSGRILEHLRVRLR